MSDTSIAPANQHQNQMAFGPVAKAILVKQQPFAGRIPQSQIIDAEIIKEPKKPAAITAKQDVSADKKQETTDEKDSDQIHKQQQNQQQQYKRIGKSSGDAIAESIANAARLLSLALAKLFDKIFGTNMSQKPALNNRILYGKFKAVNQPQTTQKLQKLAAEVAKTKGVELPKNLDRAAARDFINQHDKKLYVDERGKVMKNGKATAKMINLAKKLAKSEGFEMPEGKDFKTIRMWLNDHSNKHIKHGDDRGNDKNSDQDHQEEVKISRADEKGQSKEQGQGQEAGKAQAESEKTQAQNKEMAADAKVASGSASKDASKVAEGVAEKQQAGMDKQQATAKEATTISMRDVLRGGASDVALQKQQERQGKEGHRFFGKAIQTNQQQQQGKSQSR